MHINIFMLNIFDRIPDGLLELESHQLWQLLDRPTLIHLQGDLQPALFVSILLHGNETTSWLAMRELLRKYHDQDRRLPRSLSLFIGNIESPSPPFKLFDNTRLMIV